MKKESNAARLCKIVYFDEESVTDYIQIIAGGKLEKTSQLLDQTADNGSAEVGGKVGFSVGRLFKGLVGLDASMSAEASMEASFNTERIVKNIVKNTILTDFIEVVTQNTQSKKPKSENSIKKFTGYSISAPKDSLSYVALISPYLSMLKGGTSIPAGEFSIAADRLDNTIKNAKGYYEFVGSGEDKKVILRFNIKSFKNNYKATDLTKMDLSIYAIKVGSSSISQLDFSNELNANSMAKDNPSYQKRKKSEEKGDSEEQLDVFDVLLAGVEAEEIIND